MSTKKLQILGSFLEVDSTLTKSGQAADAQVTGQKVDALQKQIDEASALIGDSGSVSEQIASAIENKSDVGHTHGINDVDGLSDVISEMSGSMSANYDESIIGLSVDGQVITYIKGDGSVHTIVTQDTDTTYSIGTDETTGLTKLYATTGSAEDGTMTQKAIKTELDKKVGVSIDDAQDMLIFTI